MQPLLTLEVADQGIDVGRKELLLGFRVEQQCPDELGALPLHDVGAWGMQHQLAISRFTTDEQAC
ncbi:hypothetical protein D3C85_1638340 [compost metagenome]